PVVTMHRIHGDGTLGSLEDAFATGAQVPAQRATFASVVHGNALYVVAGDGRNDILRAPFRPDGKLASVEDAYAFGATPMTVKSGAISVASNDRVYVVAGGLGNLGTGDTIEVASFDQDGHVGSFADAYAGPGAAHIPVTQLPSLFFHG